jgi:DNA-binding beta-propeller fold protein YncE
MKSIFRMRGTWLSAQAVCQPGSSRLSIIDAFTGTVLKVISFSQQPVSVTYSKDGMLAYVILSGHSIVEFFASDWRETKRIPYTFLESKIVTGIDNRRAYCVSNRGVHDIDVVNSTVKSHNIQSPQRSLALSPDNRLLYIVFSGGVIVFDVEKWEKAFEIRVESAERISLDPKGKRAYVGLRGFADVKVIDLSSGELVGSILSYGHVADITLDMEGLYFFILTINRANMAVYRIGDEVEKIEDVTIGSAPDCIVVAPDNRSVYVSNRSVVKKFEML